MAVSQTDRDGRILAIGPVAISGLVQGGHRGDLIPGLGPAYALRRDTEGGKMQYAVFLGEGLGRRALMDLLYALAPYKAHGPDRFGRVLDNWGLHDRALTSTGSENLLRQHADSLKLNWQVFTDHRQLFIDIFEDQTENTRVLPVITWEKSPDGSRTWLLDELDPAFVQAAERSIPGLRKLFGAPGLRIDPLVGLVAIPYLQPELHRKWRPWQSLVRNGKSNYVGPASVPVVALMHRRAILNSKVIHAVEELEFEA